MRQFVRLGWHLDGLTWDDYLDMSIYETFVLHDELADILERTNSVKPKDFRKG